MELIAVLLAAYLGSGMLRLPRGSVLLAQGRGRWRTRTGRGRFIGLPLRPSRAVLLATPAGDAEPDADVRASIAGPAALTHWERVLGHTGGLAWSADLYALLWFVLTPALIVLYGENGGLLIALGPLILGHTGASLLLWRAWRRLRKAGTPLPGSEVAAAILFPPSLIRSRQTLLREIPGALDPVAARVRVGSREQQRQALASALARADLEPSGPRISLRRQALRALAGASGLDDSELAAPPEERSADAASYCPLCFAEFRSGFARCADCGVPLRAFGRDQNVRSTSPVGILGAKNVDF